MAVYVKIALPGTPHWNKKNANTQLPITNIVYNSGTHHLMVVFCLPIEYRSHVKCILYINAITIAVIIILNE